jgi:hypothetical protein
MQGLTTTTVHREEDIRSLASTDLLILTNASLNSLQKINYSRGFHIIRDPRDLEIKFEDLIRDPQKTWASILDHIGIKTTNNPLLSHILLLHNKIINSISRRSKLNFNKWMHIKNGLSEEQIQTILKNYSFENLSGNPKGVEDVQNHYRKGTSGDWKNYFTDKHKSLFKEQWGELLIHLGYEQNTEWN